MTPSPPVWHSRGYLPHFEGGRIPQLITFRLADSLPAERLEEWKLELKDLPGNQAALERRKRIEEWLDRGLGEAWLRDERVAQIVEQALLHFDGQRYYLHAWVIMPNHVHVLCTLTANWSLSTVVHSWKSFTAKRANQLLDRSGGFWQEEYFDRYIRDPRHFGRAVEYIEANPVKAGLCRSPEEWRFSSASRTAL